MKAKKLFTNARILVLLAFVLLSLVAIHPTFSSDGVAIRSVLKNSSAEIGGLQNPSPTTSPVNREVIQSVNNFPITDLASYNDVTKGLEANQDVVIKTNKQTYFLTTKPIIKIIELDEFDIVNETTQEFDNETNQTINITTQVQVPKVKEEIIGVEELGITVYDRPTNNIRKGLDLEGGTRVLLKPQTEVSDEDVDILVTSIRQRLNVFGVSDIIVRPTTDFSGDTFISVEIPGVNNDEVRELLSQQGKFEARVGAQTVFLGGDDVAYVCRTSDCSGIDPQGGCGQDASGQHFCSFRFAISLSPEAAQRQAQATGLLDVLVDHSGQGYLSENLSLYLDDELVDELRIAAELKGSAQTDISITGSGSGLTQELAVQDTLAQMKELQTVLISGSLPVKLDIVKTDAISPLLGESFLQNVILIGFLAIFAVILVVVIRYREWKVSIPMVVIMVSEVVILLGLASIIGWRLDIAAIAGIIIAVGTGVDDQIVIADETISRSKRKQNSSWKDRLKRAFFIIMAAYFTTTVAMLPLWFAGAGLLKGFALTTILGISIGVFITRPAFATIMETLLNK